MTLLFPKSQIVRDRGYLNSLRDQPCIVTGGRDCEPAHLRLLGSGGVGKKPSDAKALPLHWSLHRQQSGRGEGMFWVQMANEHPDFLWRLLLEVAESRYQTYLRSP